MAIKHSLGRYGEWRFSRGTPLLTFRHIGKGPSGMHASEDRMVGTGCPRAGEREARWPYPQGVQLSVHAELCREGSLQVPPTMPSKGKSRALLWCIRVPAETGAHSEPAEWRTFILEALFTQM